MSQTVTFQNNDDDSTCSHNAGKRPKATAIEDPTDEELAGMSRSERKRHREKKRRSEVNKGFDDLTKLLQEIDPSIGSSRNPSQLETDNAMNRVDLINVTVSVLERVHRENERNKRIISEQGLGARRRDESVVVGRDEHDSKQYMMVMPFLTPVGDDRHYQHASPRIPEPHDPEIRDHGQYYGGYGNSYPAHRERQSRPGFY